jgi:biotin-(acetyl-CoA carboxylase) ligase
MNIKEKRRERREEDEKLKEEARTFLENRKGEEFSLNQILKGIGVNLQPRKKERVIIISDMQGRLRKMLRELEKEELIEIIERDSEKYYKYKE